MWGPSHGMGLEPNQKVLRYFIAFVPLSHQYILQAGLCCACGVVAEWWHYDARQEGDTLVGTSLTSSFSGIEVGCVEHQGFTVRL